MIGHRPATTGGKEKGKRQKLGKRREGVFTSSSAES